MKERMMRVANMVHIGYRKGWYILAIEKDAAEGACGTAETAFWEADASLGGAFPRKGSIR